MDKLFARLVRQSPAMIVAMLALFVALTGTAVATTSALITGKSIKNGSITGLDIKNKSLTATDIKGQLRGLRGLQGPAGAAGAKGDKGDKGDPGAPNPNAVNSDRLDGQEIAIIRHTTAAANLSNDLTFIDHPNTNNNPTAHVVAIHMFGPLRLNKVLGVHYFPAQNKWGIYTEDATDMPAGHTFHVLVVDSPGPPGPAAVDSHPAGSPGS